MWSLKTLFEEITKITWRCKSGRTSWDN